MELLLRVLMNMIPTYVAGPSASTQIVVLPGTVPDSEKTSAIANILAVILAYPYIFRTVRI